MFSKAKIFHLTPPPGAYMIASNLLLINASSTAETAVAARKNHGNISTNNSKPTTRRNLGASRFFVAVKEFLLIALTLFPTVHPLISLLASALERVSKFQRWPQMHLCSNVYNTKAVLG
jgi:hypothetical protein